MGISGIIRKLIIPQRRSLLIEQEVCWFFSVLKKASDTLNHDMNFLSLLQDFIRKNKFKSYLIGKRDVVLQ